MSKQLIQRTTSKKMKVVGFQDYVNVTTGEVVPMAVSEIQERDFNFSKVWMRNFISTLELVGNKKTKLSYWIIEHLDKENKLCLSYRQISEETGFSLETVRVTMKALLEADFIRKVGTAYQVNPNIIFKGNRNARMAICTQYNSVPNVEPTREQKIKMLTLSIEDLQQSLNRLLQEEENEKLKKENDLVVEDQLSMSFNEQGDAQYVQRAKPARKE